MSVMSIVQNFVEREGRKKTHGLAISLDSIKFPNNLEIGRARV